MTQFLSFPLTPRRLPLPIAEGMARAGLAGFPSPAEDYASRQLDLNERYVKRPAATFFFEATGDSMLEYGIPDGCILLVDRSIDARPGHVVVAIVEGEMVVKAYERRGRHHLLCSGGDRYPPIPMNDVECQIWGVVRSIHVEFIV